MLMDRAVPSQDKGWYCGVFCEWVYERDKKLLSGDKGQADAIGYILWLVLRDTAGCPRAVASAHVTIRVLPCFRLMAIKQAPGIA